MPAVKTRAAIFLAAMIAACCLPLTAHTRTAENSPLGLVASVTGSHRAASAGNLHNALRFEAELRQTRVRSRCTAKLRDYESGLNLDYFGARYYGGAMGRFTSPDPLTGWPSDPQSWNMYAYGRNSPLKYVDPDGMNYVVCDGNGENCRHFDDQTWQDYAKENNIKSTVGGSLYVVNDDGSSTTVGSASYYNERALLSLKLAGLRADAHIKEAATQMAVGAAFGGAQGAFFGARLAGSGLTRAYFTHLQGHHAIPKFLGGAPKQGLSSIPQSIHKQFHALLSQELKKAGIPLRIGGRGGSTLDWAGYMNANPGTQHAAFKAVLSAAKKIDSRYGTQLARDVLANISRGRFTPMP